MSGEPTAVGTSDPITVYRRTLRPEGRILAATFGSQAAGHPSLWGPWVVDGTAHQFADGSILGWLNSPLDNSASLRLADADGQPVHASSVHLCDPHGNVVEVYLWGGDE